MRRLCVALAVLSVGATVVVAVPSAEAAAAPVPGSYTAITPYRAADTFTGVNGNRKGALPAKSRSQVSLAGHVPSTASAAVVAVSAVAPTTNGFLTLYRAGLATAPPTWTELYRARVTTTVTTVVPLSAAKFLIANNAGSGSTNYAVDVLGYYAGGTVPSGTNLMHTATPFRVLGSATTLAPGQSVTAHVGPSKINSTAALMIHVLSATRAGKLVAYLSKTTPPTSSTVYYQSGYGTSAFAQLRLGNDGDATFTNRGTGTIRLAVDQLGWSGRTAATVPGALQAVAPERAYEGTSIRAGGVTRFTLGGRHGMAQAGLGTALVAVVVDGPTATGGIDVGAPGTTTTAVRTLSFRSGETQAVQVPVATGGGQIEIRNQSSGALEIYLDVLGYYPTTSPPAATTAVGRYLTTLHDSRTAGYLASDLAAMRGWADSDAGAGVRTVLLDLGAQTFKAPLSTSDPGIALAVNQAETTVVIKDGKPVTEADSARLDYGDLAKLISGYLAEYAAKSGGRAVTVQLGVNNDGDWDAYPAARRAADFAAMLDAVTVPAGSKVVAAGDFEPGFGGPTGSSPLNALAWKADYQAVGGSTRPFVFIGAASGCPSDFGSTAPCVNDGSADWTQAQFAELASGTNTTALPQVYNPLAAVEWANIAVHYGAKIDFVGTLSESARDDTQFTGPQAQAALFRGLSWARISPALGGLTLELVPDGA